MERVRRRWWTVAVTVTATLVILGALITAGFQLVILIAPGYRTDIADYVSRVAGQPVDIGGVGLGWSGLAPRLDLSDITLYAEDGETPALSADRLRLGFGLRRLLGGDSTPTLVDLSGLQLFAQITEDGHFSLRGLDTGGGPSRARQDWLRQIGHFQHVDLSNCDLLLEDARLGGPARRFRLVEAEVVFADGRGRATAELELPRSIGSSVELEASIRGDLDRPETWNGRWSAKLEGLSGLPWLDAKLAAGAQLGIRNGDLSLGGELIAGDLGPVRASLRAAAVVGRRGKREAVLHEIASEASYSRGPSGWTLDIEQLNLSGLDGPWPQTRLRVQGSSAAQGWPSLDVSAEYLRLRDLAPWAVMFGSADLQSELSRLSGVSGVVRGLVLRSRGDGVDRRFSLRADLENLALAGSTELPGLEGISGEFSASENSGTLVLSGTPIRLHYPKVFAVPVDFQRLSGTIDWTRSVEGWRVRMPQFTWQLAGSKGEGEFDLFMPLPAGSSPKLDLTARFSAGDVNRLKPYMPLHWGQGFRDWLARAVVAGRSPSGRLRIEGPLADFPFVDQPGTFALDIDVADGQLAYAPDWPAVEKVAARLEFRGKSLSVHGTQGTVSGARLDGIEAMIPSFQQAQLSVNGEAQGDAARFYDFLRASPLAVPLSGLLERTQAAGEAAVKFTLELPIKTPREARIRGSARLHRVQLDVKNLNESVRDIEGELAFDNHGATAEQLTGRMYDTPLTASLASEPGRINVLRAAFDFVPDAGGAGISRLLPAFLRSRLEGRSHWGARLALNGPQAGIVHLESNLQGLAVKLPQPMLKEADALWPTALELGRDSSFPLRLGLEVTDRLGAELAFRPSAEDKLELARARFRAGAGGPARAEDDGLFVGGTVEDLEPLSWVEVLKSSDGDTPAGASLPATVELNVGRLWLGRQLVEGVRLRHEPAAGGWLTRLNGNGAQGELGFRAGEDGGSLQGRFQHLHVDDRGLPGHEDARKPSTVAAPKPLDPAQLPRLDLEVDQFQIGAADLGRLELRTARIAGGQRIERLRTTGTGAEIEASGQWRRTNDRSSAQLTLSLQSDAIGEVLRGLGYAPSLSARRSRFNVHLEWPETAAKAVDGIEPALGQGRIDLELDKGLLRTVEPGAGRVLGLINFWAIPRRLTLDFRDVVSEGLSYDKVQGSFAIADGVATTQDLLIDAPSLNMEVRGRVGLIAHDYDQRVTVYPDVSAGVTLGALLLGGPAAGALALIAQEVLDQPLDQVGQLSYRLTGTWEDPQVVRVSGGGGDAPPSSPADPVPGTPPAKQNAPFKPAPSS